MDLGQSEERLALLQSARARVCASFLRPNLGHLLVEPLGAAQVPSLLERPGQIMHGGQGVWMLGSEDPASGLQHLLEALPGA
jgi:hypothetical protein